MHGTSRTGALLLSGAFWAALNTPRRVQAGEASDPEPVVRGDAVAASLPSAEDERNPPEYAEHVELGVLEHGRGHFEEARSHFAEAHRIFPNARTLRALGKVEFELRNYGDASALLRQALDATARPLDGELRAETEKLLARALAYVGELHVDVAPDSATVSVDGVVMARGPMATLWLRVGEHELEFRAEGRSPERRRVFIEGGGHARLQVELPAEAKHSVASAEPPATTTSRPLERQPWYRRWPVWVSVAAVAVAGGVAAAVASPRDHSRSVTLEPIGTSQTPPGGTIRQ